jgi:predicted transcriptional regulator of viral defense system
MDFERLLEIVGEEPIFETSLLLAGNVNPGVIRLQISRWTRSGRLYQLRRGLYAIAPPYQKIKPHPFVIANQLQRASYVSAQSALAYYGLIPDVVTTVISVTAGRPERLNTPLGVFEFRHVKPALFNGYRLTDLGRQQALVATPEKALLDLVYLQPDGDTTSYLQELRLQNLDRLNLDQLQTLSEALKKPKLCRAVEEIADLSRREAEEYEVL